MEVGSEIIGYQPLSLAVNLTSVVHPLRVESVRPRVRRRIPRVLNNRLKVYIVPATINALNLHKVPTGVHCQAALISFCIRFYFLIVIRKLGSYVRVACFLSLTRHCQPCVRSRQCVCPLPLGILWFLKNKNRLIDFCFNTISDWFLSNMNGHVLPAEGALKFNLRSCSTSPCAALHVRSVSMQITFH